tara:strand:- start:6704 stop:7009 length:306 start_codon:yes stop_codon:yes gene_type:complete
MSVTLSDKDIKMLKNISDTINKLNKTFNKGASKTVSDRDKKENLKKQYAQKNTKKKSKPINRINAIVGNRASSKYILEEAKQKNKQKKMGGGKVHMKKKKK